MKHFLCLFILTAVAIAAPAPAKKKAPKREPAMESAKARMPKKMPKSNYKSFGWKVRYDAFCRCQRDIYDSFAEIIVAPRVDLVAWSRCDEITNDKRKPQISYQGSPHSQGYLSAMNSSGAYALKMELAREVASAEKVKAERKFFGAGDMTFKFTRRSEWNFDMDLEVQNEKAPDESFTIKNLNKLSEADAETLLNSLLQATVMAHHPDAETIPGKLKDLIGQCRVQLGFEEEPVGSDPKKRRERIEQLSKSRTLELFRETYTTCFRSEEVTSLPDSPFALIEKCFNSIAG